MQLGEQGGERGHEVADETQAADGDGQQVAHVPAALLGSVYFVLHAVAQRQRGSVRGDGVAEEKEDDEDGARGVDDDGRMVVQRVAISVDCVNHGQQQKD